MAAALRLALPSQPLPGADDLDCHPSLARRLEQRCFGLSDLLIALGSDEAVVDRDQEPSPEHHCRGNGLLGSHDRRNIAHRLSPSEPCAVDGKECGVERAELPTDVPPRAVPQGIPTM